ncbi:Uncharacterized protein Adt_30701 [Abeliophyllum distichum]|uniref:DUF7851 domain-containing protein n=1 Tax=Abeliophyllum distichum TaxID=126358 RepID=A0ABD1RC14_9LAMI
MLSRNHFSNPDITGFKKLHLRRRITIRKFLNWKRSREAIHRLKNKNKKQKKLHPNDQNSKIASNFAVKPCSEVKRFRFGSQFIVKSFTIRRARPLELFRLFSLPPPTTVRAPPPHLSSSSLSTMGCEMAKFMCR